MYSGSFGVNHVPIFTTEESARRGAIPPQPRVRNNGNGDQLQEQRSGFTLKIKDIAVCCDEWGLRGIFGKYGRIVDAKVEVNNDKDGNPMSRFGHVTFWDRAEAEAARELHGYTMGGMVMRIYPGYKASNLFVPSSPETSNQDVDYTESGLAQEFVMPQQFDYASTNSMNASAESFQSNVPQSHYNATGGYATITTAAGTPGNNYEENNNNFDFNNSYCTPNGYSGDGNHNSFINPYQESFTSNSYSEHENNSFNEQYQHHQDFTPNGHSGDGNNSSREQYHQDFIPNGHSGDGNNSFHEQYHQEFIPNGHSGGDGNSSFNEQNQQTYVPNGKPAERQGNSTYNDQYQEHRNYSNHEDPTGAGSGMTYHGQPTMPVQVEVPNGFVIPPTGTWGFINPNMQFSPLVSQLPVLGVAPHMTSAPGMAQVQFMTSAPGMTQAPQMMSAPGMAQAPFMTSAPGMVQSPLMTQAPVMAQSPIMTQAPLHAQPQPSLRGSAPGPLVPLLTSAPPQRSKHSTSNGNTDQSFPFRKVAMVDQPHPPVTVESLHRRQQNRGGVRSSGNRSPQRAWNGASGNRPGQQGNYNNRNRIQGQGQDNRRESARGGNNSRRGGRGRNNNNGVNNYNYQESYDEQQQMRQMQYRDTRSQGLRQLQQPGHLQNGINGNMYDQHSHEEFPQLQMRRYTNVTNVINYNLTLAAPPEN